MSICDRGNALEKDVGKRQFFDRVPYPPQATQLIRQANALDRNVHRIPYGSDSRDLVGVNDRYVGRALSC
jgi:hypothetical protein